ncbi:hypothetical protein MPL1032_180026 [Mesorhizobium plurifarium]|uniref:Uncharacterized protein n=1 Tax=Mesorhizobium plurifarium TaxID=69974 RepID=A0A0K2VU52_MESPL|nr:hypothetical protein MPL1032_180026 [Mesorhizobium plurifarium]
MNLTMVAFAMAELAGRSWTNAGMENSRVAGQDVQSQGGRGAQWHAHGAAPCSRKCRVRLSPEEP